MAAYTITRSSLLKVLNVTWGSPRSLFTSSQFWVEQDWRYRNGLPRNPNAYGPLTDNADFSFTDGRPTPLLMGQQKRLQKHRQYAEKIVTAVREMDFAVARHSRIQREKEEERQAILDSKLKPKAHHLLKKTNAK